jgi:predicted nucleic acid-binding Zn ribbon protein
MGEEEDDQHRARGDIQPEPQDDQNAASTGHSGNGRPPHRPRTFRRGERYPRNKRRARLEELIKALVDIHGLTDEVRQISVYLFWRRIVGPQIASKTSPDSISNGVLRVWTKTSAWLHELQFHKALIIEQINAFIARWPGGPPLVTDIRFGLGTQREDVSRDDHLRQLRRRQWRRRPPPPNPLPIVSDADRAVIQAETERVEDDDLRATIERVRLRWNR